MNRIRVTSMFLAALCPAALTACSGDDTGPELSPSEPGSNAAALTDVVSTTSTFTLSDEPFTTPLPIPPVLAPSASDASTDYYELSIRPALAQLRPGAATPIVGFDGIAPGPTLVATRGRTLQVTQTNDWDEPVSVHNHGHKVAEASDGHPTDPVEPGESRVFSYPNDQSAGTYWYHDHTMDLTGPHVYQGLAGFYLIQDPAEEALGLPSGEYDIPLLLQDKTFNDDNTLSYEHDHFVGFIGDTPLVNGAISPFLDVGTRKYRFRVLNGANARPMALELRVAGSNAAESFQIIGSDGGLLPAPLDANVLLVAPAERYDIVVDFSEYAVGTQLELVSLPPAPAFAAAYGGGAPLAGLNGAPFGPPAGFGPGGGGPGGFGPGGFGPGGFGPGGFGPGGGPFGGPPDGTFGGPANLPELGGLLQFVVARSEQDPSVVPSQLAVIDRLDPADAVGEREISFQYDGVDWTMNGLTYDPERADIISRLDQVYIWTLRNESALPHPFHKHLSLFNVLDINGEPPPAFAGAWKDTVVVPPFGTARIVFKDETFTGTYVFHCHNLEHEDHHMMLQERVEN